MLRIILLLFIITAVDNCFMQTSARSDYEDRPFSAGLRIVDFEYIHPDGKREVLTTAIWYPTEEKMRTFIYHTERDY